MSMNSTMGVAKESNLLIGCECLDMHILVSFI